MDTYPAHFNKRDHDHYKELYARLESHPDHTQAESLQDAGLKYWPLAVWDLPRASIGELFKGDVLHTILLGMLKHLMNWLRTFLAKHGRLHSFDIAWKTAREYPGFRPFLRGYADVYVWTGKEMRNVLKIVLPCVAAALRNPDPGDRLTFARAIRCVKALVDFSLMTQYRSHTAETLAYMEQYLCEFHDTKDIFAQFRAFKQVREKAEKERKGIIERLTKEIPAEYNSRSRRERLQEIHEEATDAAQHILETESHFSFPKMHLLNHFFDQVRRFGTLQQFSTETSEAAHKDMVQAGYNHSNKVDANRQIIHDIERRHAMKMKALDIAFLTSQAQSDPNTPPTPPKVELGSQIRKLKTIESIIASYEFPCEVLTLLSRYIRSELPVGSPWRGLVNEESVSLYPAFAYKLLRLPLRHWQDTDDVQVVYPKPQSWLSTLTPSSGSTQHQSDRNYGLEEPRIQARPCVDSSWEIRPICRHGRAQDRVCRMPYEHPQPDHSRNLFSRNRNDA